MTFSSLRRFPFLRLLFAGLVAFLWIRSHRRSDILGLFLHRGYANGLISDRGKAVAFHTNISFGGPRAYTYDFLTMPNDEFIDVRAMLYQTAPLPTPVAGLLMGHKGTDAFSMLPGSKYQYVVVPFWMLAIVTGVPLLAGLRTFWVRRKWGTANTCGGCGYDLRASSGRCPECGWEIPVAKTLHVQNSRLPV